jgi:TRAP-type C4-dicarboxylate transport system permease small subunit
MLRKFDGLLEALERVIVVSAFSLLIILAGGGFLARYFFGYTSMDMLTLQPALLMWLSLVGGSIAIRQGKHIRLELLLRFMPDHLKTLAHRAGGVFGCVVMVVLLYLSKDFVESSIALSGWSGYLTLIMPVFFVVATFRYLMQIIYPHP